MVIGSYRMGSFYYGKTSFEMGNDKRIKILDRQMVCKEAHVTPFLSLYASAFSKETWTTNLRKDIGGGTLVSIIHKVC